MRPSTTAIAATRGITRELLWGCENIVSCVVADSRPMEVATCVAAYARKFGEDEEKWAVTGLLHDFDWEIHPNLPDHPTKGEPMLAERGVSEEIRRAILSHADFTGIPRVSMLEVYQQKSFVQVGLPIAAVYFVGTIMT